jgi:mersacidin/lichenicidin family type 2 lantibiotic
MSNQTIIRAWKDAEFRASLGAAQRAALPANPAGVVELEEAELKHATGGRFALTLTCTGAPSINANTLLNCCVARMF